MSWQKVKLGDLCTIEKGKTGIQKAVPGEFPLVVTAEERKSHNEYQFDDEAVIIPLVSGTGHGHASIKRLHFQSGKFALGSILCAVIAKDKSILNTEYLYRFLNLNKERELVDRMKGMANVTLPIKEIAKIEIPLPSLEEQIEFVEKYALLEIDSEDISSELTHQLDLIKQLRQAFLREAMQGKLCHAELVSASQETGHDLLAKIKAEKAQLIAEKKLKKEKELPSITKDEIPFEIPEHWAWCRLFDLCEFINGKAHEKFVSENGNYILVTSRFVSTSGKTIKKTSALLTPLYINNIAIVMSDVPNGRALARSFLIDKDGIYTLNQRIGGIIPLEAINSKFLNIILNRNSFYLKFDDGKKQTNLRKDQILSCPIPLPPLHEQEQIVAKLEELMAFCDGLEESIKESQGYNEKLLQQVLREALQGESISVKN